MEASAASSDLNPTTASGSTSGVSSGVVNGTSAASGAINGTVATSAATPGAVSGATPGVVRRLSAASANQPSSPLSKRGAVRMAPGQGPEEADEDEDEEGHIGDEQEGLLRNGDYPNAGYYFVANGTKPASRISLSRCNSSIVFTSNYCAPPSRYPPEEKPKKTS